MEKNNLVPVVSRKFTVSGERFTMAADSEMDELRNIRNKIRDFETIPKRLTEDELKLIILVAVTIKVIKGKLNMPKKQWDYLATSKNMEAAILANALGYFTPAFAGLSNWALENTALEKALNAIKNRVVGGAGMKVTAMANLKITLDLALAYVNAIAKLNQPNAITIIEAALMTVINQGPRVIKPITVKVGTDAGTAIVSCPATTFEGKRVAGSYEKQWSADGGKTWVPLTTTSKCKIIATGLASGVPVIFRSRTTTTKGGTSAWVVSAPVTPV